MTHKAGASHEFRCACGTLVVMDPQQGGYCPRCQRHIPAPATDAGVETLALVAPSTVSPAEDRSPVESSEVGVDDLVGTHLEHFEIVSRLAKGGMGAVYRAWDTSLQRHIALKVIRAYGETSSEPEEVSKLLREARAQARLNHPNVVQVYYVSRSPDTPFLAMELVPGDTLADRLQRGPLSFAGLMDIAIQVTRALQRASELQIVHGDVKPGNILLTEDGIAKLSDFGLAQSVESPTAQRHAIAGTPNYLAPECCRGAQATIQSDMYSLGITCFEMTFGRLPYTFADSDLQSRIRAHCAQPVDFPDPWPDSLPEGWLDVLSQLLAKDPADRFTDYKSLLKRLRRLRPIPRRTAGWFVRGVAWGVDLMLVSAAVNLTYAAFDQAAASLPASADLIRLIGTDIAAPVPLVAAYLQGRTRTSPGKRLFQIRVVDLHGLPAHPITLSYRALAQLVPVWMFVVPWLLKTLGIAPLAVIVFLACGGWLLVDTGLALLSRDGRSLHDRIFGTRVVLDTGDVSEGG